MSLTASEIAKVMGELSPALTGGWIQKIYQPADRTILLEIRAQGRTHRLLISCDQKAARLHFTTSAFQNLLT
ncbi:MAG TPA: NFACT family protein, partial [Nitrospiraceae bacterium]